MFGGAGQAAVERVQVHLLVVDHIAADHRALVEMDVVQIVDQPRRIIQILRGGFAVVQRDRIDDMHGRPGGAVVDVGAGQMQVMLGVAGMQRDVAGGDGQHVLDQRARKADAAVIALDRPRFGQDLRRPRAGPGKGRSVPARPARRRGSAATPASVRGLYWPPGMPGRTGARHRPRGPRALPRGPDAHRTAARGRVRSQRRFIGDILHRCPVSSWSKYSICRQYRAGRHIVHTDPFRFRVIHRLQAGDGAMAPACDLDLVGRAQDIVIALPLGRHIAHADRRHQG
jgi:hypothetical protein